MHLWKRNNLFLNSIDPRTARRRGRVKTETSYKIINSHMMHHNIIEHHAQNSPSGCKCSSTAPSLLVHNCSGTVHISVTKENRKKKKSTGLSHFNFPLPPCRETGICAGSKEMLRTSLALCTVAMVTASCSYSAFTAGVIRLVQQRQLHQAFGAVPGLARYRWGCASCTSNAGGLTSSLAPRTAATPVVTREHKESLRTRTQSCRKATFVTVDDAAVTLDESRCTPKTSVAVVAKINNGSGFGVSNTAENEVGLDRCRQLAQELDIDLVLEEGENRARKAREKSKFRFTMLFDEKGRLGLGQPGSGFNPLVVDFSGGKNGHRAKQVSGSEQVVKAAALSKRRNVSPNLTLEEEIARELGGYEPELPLLWDLTAGLGTDAFVLALAGWRVEMFERSPIVAALVQDALERAVISEDHAASAAASRMSLTVADSIDVAAEVAARASGDGASASARDGLPAVVYLDPMFPRRKKTALVKKEMRMLQALVEEEIESSNGVPGNASRKSAKEEEEEQQLFDAAMRLATRKVVVKRPVHGPEIVDHIAPSHSVIGKNSRFDVYSVTEGSC